MISIFAFLLALVLDQIIGEVRRFHPLVGFGYCASRIERAINHTKDSSRSGFFKGVFASCLVISLPLLCCSLWYQYFPEARFFFDAVLLYFAVGYKSLCDHVKRIYKALSSNDLVQARDFTSQIVSRDTADMTENSVRKSALESLLENGSDAVFAPIFWFLCFGGLGALFYRLANTLDAMWGYKNTRFLYFGKFSAYLDDGLNWVPARLVALSYALLGNFSQGLRCWRHQAGRCASPNAGPVMAAGAGALGLKLGGNASYQGVIEERPILGEGRLAENDDIVRALKMVRNTLWVWIVLVIIFYLWVEIC